MALSQGFALNFISRERDMRNGMRLPPQGQRLRLPRTLFFFEKKKGGQNLLVLAHGFVPIFISRKGTSENWHASSPPRAEG